LNDTQLSALKSYLTEIAPYGRKMLLPALHKAQEYYGWLPEQVQVEIGKALRVPLAEIHGVVEFYTMFYNRPTARRVLRVCEDSACWLAGSQEFSQALEGKLGLKHGETSSDGALTYERVPCLGMCELAPAALNGNRPAGQLTPDSVDDFLAGTLPVSPTKVYGHPAIITKTLSIDGPISLEDYLEHGGYQGLRKAFDLHPELVMDAIETTGILGRGGAMFPLGNKWRYTRHAPGDASQKHIIVNADESEPGTFKDRFLLELDPYSVIESATLAAYTIGAENGWIFVRGEYPGCFYQIQKAVNQARSRGYLGRNILGHQGFNFDIQVYLGAGAYICGEETALFEAIEGKRGFPRIKPPFPTTHGLFQQPTAINNVETLVAALKAWTMGVENWNAIGTPESPGSKLFCLSGHIQKPGLYEVPFGITIRQLIDLAGGIPGGGSIQAILMGGAAGVFIPPEKLDMPLTYEHARAENVPLGSGVVMIFDETVDLRPVLYQLARFFAHESCGKCYPCQLGTQRQKEILELVQDGQSNSHTRGDLFDIGFTMTNTSLCGLGQTAASAITSALKLWPELVE
jgi:NADH-quinone oxidoreductase subunit F